MKQPNLKNSFKKQTKYDNTKVHPHSCAHLKPHLSPLTSAHPRTEAALIIIIMMMMIMMMIMMMMMSVKRKRKN